MNDALPKDRQVPLFLAPMAGVTNTVFRRICRSYGADILTSEFVSADGILHRNARTREYLDFDPEERPFGVQLFGSEPEHLARAAVEVMDWVNPDFMDINFGCPVNKVVCRCGGSALLRDLPLLERVAAAVVRAVAPRPVTAKIRIGWSAQSVNATETALRLEGAGVTRIAVHGRTKEQGYSGEANWDVIAEVAQCVRVPVIGNGDISSVEDARRRVEQTGVAGLMIGRAAMNRPWLFSQIQAAWRGEEIPHEPVPHDRWQRILEHCRKEIAWRGNENLAMRSLRSRLMAYSRGMEGSRHLRERLGRVDSLTELEDVAGEHLHSLTK